MILNRFSLYRSRWSRQWGTDQNSSGAQSPSIQQPYVYRFEVLSIYDLSYITDVLNPQWKVSISPQDSGSPCHRKSWWSSSEIFAASFHRCAQPCKASAPRCPSRRCWRRSNAPPRWSRRSCRGIAMAVEMGMLGAGLAWFTGFGVGLFGQDSRLPCAFGRYWLLKPLKA